jgi:hypothetical protein
MQLLRISTLAILLGASALTADAQSATGLPGCKGTSAIMRTSTLTGPLAKFQAAVAAHTKWYRDHGVKGNEQLVVSLYKRVDTTWVVDSTQVMTIHTNPPSPGPKHDAGWDAFTKLYADVSKVTSTSYVCLPKPF